jgi:hypothetical protein
MNNGVDEHDAELIRGGPNRALSLREARRNFFAYRAADQRFVTRVRDPLNDELYQVGLNETHLGVAS